MGGADAGVCVGMDIGRHRLFVASDRGETATLIPMADDHDGLLLRWMAGDGPKRFSDRVRQSAGIDGRGVAASADVAVEALARLHGDERIRIAIPASFGPQCRADVVRGMRRQGLDVGPHDLIERPVAAAAGWLAHRRAVSGTTLTHPVLLIDNDGGELSALAFDPGSTRLLTVAPLNVVDGDDTLADVAARIRDLIDCVARLTHPADELVRDDSAQAAAARIRTVVLTGNGATQPSLIDMVSELLPHASFAPDPVTPAEQCVATGLLHLDELESWMACWPTLDLATNRETLVHRGPQAALLSNEEHLALGAETLRLVGPYDTSIDVTAGSCRGSGIAIPAVLRDELRVKVLDDGRVLLLGPHGVPPLALLFGWPCPGTDARAVALRSVGRRAVTVADELQTTAPPAATVTPAPRGD